MASQVKIIISQRELKAKKTNLPKAWENTGVWSHVALGLLLIGLKNTTSFVEQITERRLTNSR